MKKLLLGIIFIGLVSCKKDDTPEPEPTTFLYRSDTGDYIQYSKGQFKTTDTISVDIKVSGEVNKGVKFAYKDQSGAYHRYTLVLHSDTLKIDYDSGRIIYQNKQYFKTGA